jgi:DNA polymerase III alpha subunit
MYSIRHRLVRYEKSDKVLRAIWKRQGHYGKCLSLCEDGRLRRNAVVDIQPAGVRELFEILLEDGRTIRVTDNHRFPTNFGEMTTADLMKKHRYTPQLYVLADDRVNGIRGVKDGLDTVFARVKSVTPIGPGETYDVTMESPHHTFVNDQGVVTCNSHAVTYAFNTYESAYFKAHFPHYFYMSYLDGARHKMKPLKEIRSIIREARRFKIGVTAPVFGKLEPTFSTDLVRIRFGLTNMKDVGEKAVAKIQDKLRDSPLLEWSWFDFLKFGSAVCGASAVRRFIQAGAMGEYELPRQRMLAEFDAWSELTPTEREHVIGLGEPLTKTIAVKEKQVRYTEVDGKRRKKTVEVKVGEEVVVVDEARPVASLEEALLGLLARPKAVTPKRVEKIRSLHSLLHNPPSPLKDTDYLIAKYEEEILGIPISTSPLKNVDRSVLNCTIKEFLDGKQSYELLVIGAEVVDVVERTIRNGDNRGAAMGSLVVTDGEQTLDDVVVFSEAWEKYRLTLMRPGILVALGGRRNARKNKNGFVVDKVWTL